MSNFAFAILYVIALTILGCNDGADRLEELVAKFPLARTEINEIQELIFSIERTEGMTGLEVGSLYSNTPSKAIFKHGKPVPYTEAISKIGFKSKEKLERLLAVSQRLPCRSVEIDEGGRLWIVTYYGRNSDWGYVFGKVLNQPANKDERYLDIPGEGEWHSFRR